jgi:UDP-4-amino-4,6-dideoxy-N-acetyl-beta-L-altrosamine N-acetyltransferase
MISFRDLRPDDKEMIRAWRNMPEVGKYMYSDHVITPEEHDRWFQRIESDPSCRYWIIVCDSEDVGLVNLYAIDQRNRRCYWAFYIISPNVRGKGVGSLAEYFIFNYVFEELKLNKLCCEVLAFNQPVVDMHKSFGFVQEGLFRKHVFKQEQPHDVVCLGLLREEWDASKARLEEKLRAKGLI